MRHKSIRLGLAAIAGVLLLAACGGGGNRPPPGSTTLEGSARTPTTAGSIQDTEVLVCLPGTDCSGSSWVASRFLSGQGPQAPWSFSSLPTGNYDVHALQELELQGSFPPGVQVPDIWYYAGRANVPTGSSNVDLQMELEATAPTNDTAVMTGVLYMPGSLGSAAADEDAAGPGVTAQDVAPLLASGASGGALGGTASIAGAEPPDSPSGPAAGILAAEALNIDEAAFNPLNADLGAQAVPGEIIVRFEADVLFSQSTLGTLSASGIQLQHVSGAPSDRFHLYRTAEAAGVADLMALAAELRAQPGIANAIPNWVLHAMAQPNDPLYELQWHYPALNLEAAWDIETGVGANVTVAIVDSGSINHPDLNFLPGYDFISSSGNSGDGDGRDNDPTDESDSYHGAHVAGTVAARTGNNSGIAGTSWGANLLPVRVLGMNGSGSFFDILDGISWAVGQSVGGVPNNPNPAQIVNLSLGGDFGMTCEEVMAGDANFYSDLAAQGIVVVVAAGNSNINAAGTVPANCPGVITVGATGPDHTRAPYSNYGSVVDVMAPGGDTTRTITHTDGIARPAGVLSTVLDNGGNPAYAWYQGTSMATPHVAGIAALMLADDPSLTPAQILQRLQASGAATPGCGADCGSGLIDAEAALLGTGGGGPPGPPPSSGSPTYIFFLYCDNPGCTVFDDTLSDYVVFEDLEATVIEYLVFNIYPGRYVVAAWQDLNDDFVIDEGEPFGEYHTSVVLNPNTVTYNIDFYLEAINFNP